MVSVEWNFTGAMMKLDNYRRYRWGGIWNGNVYYSGLLGANFIHNINITRQTREFRRRQAQTQETRHESAGLCGPTTLVLLVQHVLFMIPQSPTTDRDPPLQALLLNSQLSENKA